MMGNWVVNLNCFMNSCHFSKSQNDFTNLEFKIHNRLEPLKDLIITLSDVSFWTPKQITKPNCFLFVKTYFLSNALHKSISTWYYFVKRYQKSLDSILKHYVGNSAFLKKVSCLFLRRTMKARWTWLKNTFNLIARN